MGGQRECDASTRYDAPATPDAEQWDGWGTALKPAREPVIVARKPLAGTVVETALKYGTGGINIDGCRIGTGERPVMVRTENVTAATAMAGESTGSTASGETTTLGRWPANLVLSHDDRCARVGTRTAQRNVEIPGTRDGKRPAVNAYGDGLSSSSTGIVETIDAWECVEGCPVRMLDEQSGITTSGAMKREVSGYAGASATPLLRGRSGPSNQHGGTGGASRFFYCAKASRAEREFGCEKLRTRAMHSIDDADVSTQSNRRCTKCGLVKFGQPHCECADPEWVETEGSQVHNFHPTVKPIALAKWLATLLLPPAHADGSPRRILCPFSGSGSEMIGAMRAGWDEIVGIQRTSDDEEHGYVAIARARLTRWSQVRLDIDEAEACGAGKAERKAEAAGQASLFGDAA